MTSDDISEIFGPFEGLRSARLKRIVSEIENYADSPIEFSFDPRGTHLFSIEETSRSFAKRYISLQKSIDVLLAVGEVVPAAVLARSLMETVAMGCLFVNDLISLCEAGSKGRFDARVDRYIRGFGEGDVKPVHVMDAIRYLDKVDKIYREHLLEKYGDLFATFIEKIKELAPEKSIEEMAEEAWSAPNIYDFLSEVAHPNSLGTQILYPHESNVGLVDDKIRGRYEFQCAAAVWQGHHLLAHFTRFESFSDIYNERFLQNSTS